MKWLTNQKKPITEKEIAGLSGLAAQLPSSYLELLLLQNGGYPSLNAFPTTEPTSYGMTHLEIYRIMGLEELVSEVSYERENQLAWPKLYFSADGPRFLAFDFSTDEPSIKYIDYETLQVLGVAESFEAFLEGLYTETFPIEKAASFPLEKRIQLFYTLSAEQKGQLLEHLEDMPEKQVYLDLLADLIPIDCPKALALTENQLTYFRRSLTDQDAKKLFEAFKRAELDKNQLKRLEKLWED
ncbi:SMI1/KNR4 family protein [Listeria costaricensis]|uniref:SMI1/KNR4 family protein n=1 Tax=Listeria costaricensis TaxID=2026604 RepID=UPI000C082F4F|nr:SMI1/KNR4 family protein [Listeria costaricensis]